MFWLKLWRSTGGRGIAYVGSLLKVTVFRFCLRKFVMFVWLSINDWNIYRQVCFRLNAAPHIYSYYPQTNIFRKMLLHVVIKIACLLISCNSSLFICHVETVFECWVLTVCNDNCHNLSVVQFLDYELYTALLLYNIQHPHLRMITYTLCAARIVLFTCLLHSVMSYSFIAITCILYKMLCIRSKQHCVFTYHQGNYSQRKPVGSRMGTLDLIHTTVNYSISVDDIPPPPELHAEFTVGRKLLKKPRSLRHQRLLSDRDSHALNFVSDSLRRIKCCSRDQNSNIMTVCDRVKMSSPKRSSLVARQRGGGEDSLFEITSNITQWKYSQIDRMALIKHYIR